MTKRGRAFAAQIEGLSSNPQHHHKVAWYALNFSAVECGDRGLSLGLAGHQSSSTFSEKLD